jgi:hypothetical protein
MNKQTATYLIAFISITCNHCKPAIDSFTVKPLTITNNDSVSINYQTKGTPTLIFHENMIVEDSVKPGEIPIKYLEFTLVARKSNKEVRRMIQVMELPNESSTEIAFLTTLHGDTLVAAGEKNSLRWSDKFTILTIAPGSDRNLTVRHEGKVIQLEKNGSPSNEMKGSPVKGYWEIRSILTKAEKADPVNVPELLWINAVIQYKKNR